MKCYIYILQLSNNQYYIGSTNNLERRISEHQKGLTKSTRYKRPIKLIFKQKFDNLSYVRRIEYKLKKLKSRKIINIIVSNGRIDSELLRGV